jgi:16S rRNA (uracil1498-N3)-methyltransferase
MQRFFVPPHTLAHKDVLIEGDTARQISRVLRMRPGDQVCLLDGLGWEYIVSLTRFGKDEVTGETIEKRLGAGEPSCQVTLYLSLLNKADKFEWAIQKCTEIGAASFVTVHAARSISDTPGPSKVERWARIIQEAAEQSGRSLLPTLRETVSFAQALKLAALDHTAIMPALGAERSVSEALRGDRSTSESLSVIIGPEGGFTDEETTAAEQAGITLVTLGPRVLRAETAAVAALTMTLYELGELGELGT